MSGKPVTEFGLAVALFVKAIDQKVKPRAIEIGWEPEPDGSDPQPGHPATWYVEVEISPTLSVRRRARGIHQAETVLEALAAAAEALGLRVRLQYVDTAEQEE